MDSLDRDILEDGSISLGDTLPGAEGLEDDILDKIQREELKVTIWSMVNFLEEEQAYIIRQRYQGNMTLKELGKERKVSQECIRTIEAKAMRELRKPSRTALLKPFLDEYISTHAYKGSGVESFNRTWTSSTEYAALKLLDKTI